VIVTALRGGLGNQMFQYAAARRLALAHGVPLVLDLDWFHHTPASNTPRTYELAQYAIEARPTTPAESRWCALHRGRIVRRLPFLPRRWHHHRETGFAFDAAVLNLPAHTYLDGYWQSFRYFESVAERIRADLRLRAPLGEAAAALATCIRATPQPSVAVHVRRGDYVTHPAAASMHGLCGLDYYERALRRMSAVIENPTFFVFSDDIAWAKASMTFPGPVCFVEYDSARRDVEDLHLMALCAHHIIANSSFSWWGAWLGASPQQHVIAPQRWFADGRVTASLLPETWERL